MIISIPNDIKSDYQGYNSILRWLSNYSDISNSELVFDFNNVLFLQANLSALIGTIFEILESKNNKIKLINFNTGVETILRKNEFLIPFGHKKIIDNYDTAIIYKKFKPNDDIGFNEYIKTQLLNKSEFPSHSEILGREITKNIFEIYENARTHGKCDFIHTCGQFFPNTKNKLLNFTIVDKGVNIKQNVSHFLKKDIIASDAIEWAMKKGNTTKTGNTSGGLGLSLIFKFINLNKGSIQIVSSDGYYEYSNGKEVKKQLDSIFEGTIVNIKFILNDSNHYVLKHEIGNFENIF